MDRSVNLSNEEQRALHAADAVLGSGHIEDEPDAAFSALCEMLAHTLPRMAPEEAQRLEERLVSTMQTQASATFTIPSRPGEKSRFSPNGHKQAVLQRTQRLRRRLALAAATLVVVIALIGLLPGVRTAVARVLITIIGGVQLEEAQPDSLWPDGTRRDVESDEGPTAGVIEHEMAVAEAQELFGFQLPGRLPDHISLEPGADVTEFTFGTDDPSDDMTLVRMFYSGGVNGRYVSIMLQINDNPSIGWYVGEGTEMREILIGDQSVAVFRGVWRSDLGRYVETNVYNVMWRDPGGMTYHLQAHGGNERVLLEIARGIIEQ